MASNTGRAAPERQDGGRIGVDTDELEHHLGECHRDVDHVGGTTALEHLDRLLHLQGVACGTAEHCVHRSEQRGGAHAVGLADSHHRLGQQPPPLRLRAGRPPTRTSRRAPARSVPSATFFDMIELAINGIDSTVEVTSRRAYSLRSAGASVGEAPAITAPSSSSWATMRSLSSWAVQPAMASILSRVPPVWPNPRPDSWGTAAPHAATRGTRISDTLSPTPPVECLSTVGRPTADRSSRSPSRSWPASSGRARRAPCR